MIVAYRGVKFVYETRLKTIRGMIVAQMIAVLVITKILDRLVNTLKNDFNILVSEQLHMIISGLEESGEMIIPLLCILAVSYRIKEVKI
jgi:hypothetical protein